MKPINKFCGENAELLNVKVYIYIHGKLRIFWANEREKTHE
jgi:hypothetical protein